MTDTKSDDELMKLGERAELLRRWWPPVARLIRRSYPDDVKELASEVFYTALFKSHAHLNGEMVPFEPFGTGRNFAPWIIDITRAVMARHHKRIELVSEMKSTITHVSKMNRETAS